MTMNALNESRLLPTLLVLLASGSAWAQQTIDAQPDATPPDEQVVPVAEEQLPETVTEVVADDYAMQQPTPEELLAFQFGRFKELLGAGVLDEADSVAKRVVELAIKVSGPRSSNTAKALTNLAVVQHRQEQFDLAQQNFQSAIDIIEENEDRLNAQLLNPLTGLGAAQLEAGRPDLATETFGRAIHVTHVNEGPHNVEQLDLLESLAEANLRLGAVEEAKALQDTIYALNVRHSGDDAMKLIPSLMRRADWQHRAGMIFDERATYRRVIRIIEETGGKDDLRLIEPLTRLGQSFFYVDLSGQQSFQSNLITTGEIYFKRAVNIATENPDADWRLRAQTTLSLGDYYMVEGTEQRARGAYGEAWEMLSADEEQMDFRRDALESLITLSARPLPEFAGERTAADPALQEDGFQRGRITMSYAVSERGRPSGLQIIEATPPELTDFYREIQREMRRRVYRPYFIDGQPSTSPEQVFSHRFYYRQSDLDAIIRQTAETGATEPEVAEAGAAEPQDTEPGAAEPQVTEPGAAEPGAAEPGAIEPGADAGQDGGET